MTRLLQELREDHRQINTLLTILKNKLAALESGSRPNFTLMQEVVDYLAEYGGRFHHDVEDRLYKFIAEHKPGSENLVRQHLNDHEELHRLTAEISAEVEAALADSPLPLDTFADSLSRFIRCQQEHLHREEEKILPLLEQHLSDPGFAVLVAELEAELDPAASAAFRARFEGLSQALIDDLA